MSGSKPVAALWSASAAAQAGRDLAALQARLVTEVEEIIPEVDTTAGAGWFLHALSRDGEDACYVCRGREAASEWEVYVQAGRYKPMAPLAPAAGHPLPEWQGKVFKYPETLPGDDNERFARFEDLISRQSGPGQSGPG